MNKEEAIELINKLPDDIIIWSLDIGMEQVDPLDPPDETPSGRIVEIEEEESFKVVDYYNDKDKPVMKTAQKGWRTNKGERYLVKVDFISGDSGYRWWEIILGPYCAFDENRTKGHFINKEKTKLIT